MQEETERLIVTEAGLHYNNVISSVISNLQKKPKRKYPLTVISNYFNQAAVVSPKNQKNNDKKAISPLISHCE